MPAAVAVIIIITLAHPQHSPSFKSLQHISAFGTDHTLLRVLTYLLTHMSYLNQATSSLKVKTTAYVLFFPYNASKWLFFLRVLFVFLFCFAIGCMGDRKKSKKPPARGGDSHATTPSPSLSSWDFGHTRMHTRQA